MMKNVAVLTSGGDSPGMNACVRAVVKTALSQGLNPFGIADGYSGMIEGRISPLGYNDVDNIVHLGGTILGTARSEAFRTPEGRQIAIAQLKKHAIDGLIVIGGDGSFKGADLLSKEMNLAVIGIPGTIDNDIAGTDHTIGFDTALNTIIDAVDKIRDTASSHHRIFFVEVMGRNAGILALHAAIAAGAEAVLIPEEVTNIQELVAQIKDQNKGRRSSIIIVAEGDDGGGARDIMKKAAPYMEGYDMRYSVLGHIQRGGRPSAFDRVLATRMGGFAIELLLSGETNLMIGSDGEHLVTQPIIHGIDKTITLDPAKLSLLKHLLTKA